MNEDVSLQMVVGPERGVAVNADVTLGVLDAQQSIFVRVEDLQQQRKQRRESTSLLGGI